MDIQEDLKKNFDISDEMVTTVSRLFEHIPFNGDEELIILKGHLLIEEVLNTMLEKHVAHAQAIKDANLGFYKTMKVAEALYYKPERAWMWRATEKLNTLRNKMAHSLEPKLFNEVRNEFMELCKPEWMLADAKAESRYLLQTSISFLYIGVASNLEL
jgi:hypothetical protein